MTRTRSALLAAAALLTLALAACANPVTPADGPTTVPGGSLSVVGQGTIIQVGDAPPQLCLGAVAESYPPQCSGPEITGWDWASVEGHETASDVTWGSYAVWGDWDGESLAVTESIMLALYDPMPIVDDALDPANAGATPEAELQGILDELTAAAPVEVLMSWVENGYLFATVVFDDGTVQTWADDAYGPGVVQIRSALRVVD